MTTPLRFPMDPDRRAPENALFRELIEEIQGVGPRLDRIEDRLRMLDALGVKVDRNERDIQRLWKARSAKEAKGDGGFSVSAGFVKAMAAIGAAVVGAVMYLIDKAKP